MSNTSPSVSSRLAHRQRSLAWQFARLRPNTRPRTIRLVVFAVNAASPATAGPAISIKNVPIRTVDILAVIISQELKKQLTEVPLSKSIKELSNGKSTLQNEIMGDLQGEFSSAPDKGEELPLEELGAAFGSGHSGNLGEY